jgi:type IV pilus assembly protein PilN
MIRVNLLAERKQKKQKKTETVVTAEKRKAPAFLTVLLSAVAGTCLLVGLAYFLLQMNIDSLKTEFQENNAKISELKKKIDEVKKYEALNKAIEAKSNLIKTLKKSQSVPARLLDNVSKLLPGDTWLTALSFNSPLVIIEGMAFTNNDVVAFIDNLKKSPDYSDVYLEESKQGTVDKVEVYIFKLNFKTRT